MGQGHPTQRRRGERRRTSVRGGVSRETSQRVKMTLDLLLPSPVSPSTGENPRDPEDPSPKTMRLRPLKLRVPFGTRTSLLGGGPGVRVHPRSLLFSFPLLPFLSNEYLGGQHQITSPL